VLLLSPAFLASDFIWHFELPRILDHQKDGLALFPLIVRPCAWRIAPELAAIQARPSDDRALSTGTDGDVDRDLAQFAYEVAERLGRLPDAARVSANIGGQQRAGIPTSKAGNTLTATGPTAPRPGASWSGMYPATNRRLRLSVQERQELQFQGVIDYLDDGSATAIEGRVLSDADIEHDSLFRQLIGKAPAFAVAVRFKETRQIKKGKQGIDLTGEYRAVISGNIMLGNWSSGRTVAAFELRGV